MTSRARDVIILFARAVLLKSESKSNLTPKSREAKVVLGRRDNNTVSKPDPHPGRVEQG